MTSALITLLLISVILLVGCSSKQNLPTQQRWGGSEDFPRDRQPGFNRTLNLTDEERQQRAIESCQDKKEGDTCQTQSPMGETEGKCSFRGEQLICEMEMPDRPLREER